jgi:RHS repeat-associated protein
MEFEWDGYDGYGRLMTGAAEARVRVSYDYDAVYQVARTQRAFGMQSGVPLERVARDVVRLSSEWSIPVGSLRAEMAHLGGWALSTHHLFDFSRRTLLLGNGEQRSTDVRDLRKFEMTTVAGVLQCCGDGSDAATRTRLDAPYQVAIGADGSIYMNEWEEIRRVTPGGRIERIAGTGTAGYSGDGGPATSARIRARGTIIIASDGSLYFPDSGNRRVRRIKDGTITTVAGNGESPDSSIPLEEGIPATQARVNPQDVAVASDGTLYIADQFKYIRRITPDGIIQTVAGAGASTTDGTPARDFKFKADLQGLALAPDGSLYFGESNSYGSMIRKIGANGTVSTVVPTGPHCAVDAKPHDGPVSGACLEKVWFLRVGPDGSVYIPDQGGNRVRMIAPDGTIRTIAGSGQAGTFGRSGVATGESLSQPFGAAVGPDESVYLSDGAGQIIRKVTAALPRFKAGETVIPSMDGNQVYVFSGSRHLRTLDAITGAELLRFGYDHAQRLISITDVDGNVTTIERSGDAITAIRAPGGQRTTVTVDTNGYLDSVTDPAGQAHTFVHTSNGLLTELRTPRHLTHHFSYDSEGRLEKDLAPDASSLTLTRSGQGTDWSVTATTALGMMMVRNRQRSGDGSSQRQSSLPGGLQFDATVAATGVVTVASPNGVHTTTTARGDSRFGAGAPLFTQQVRFPSGLKLEQTHARTVQLSNPDDMLSVTNSTETFTVNGRTVTQAYDTQLRQMRITSAGGRTALVTTDAARRPLIIETPGFAQAQIVYETGRPVKVTLGERQLAFFTYDARQRLETSTDALNRTTTFAYDDADRVISEILPDGLTVGFGYDADGNLTSVTPPSRPLHAMAFTLGAELAAYHAPAVGGSANVTRYAYDLDRKLKTITRPDLSTITLSYDADGRISGVSAVDAGVGVTRDSVGRISMLTSASGTLTYSYDGTLLTEISAGGALAANVKYRYDSSLRVTEERVNGDAITFGWDADDLLVQAGTLTLKRDSSSGMLSGTILGAFEDSFTYNEYGEVMAYDAAYAGTSAYAVSYERDTLGRVKRATETVLGMSVTRGYEYDKAGRLERVMDAAGAPLVAYAYDGNGNRLSRTAQTGTDTGTYDAQDRASSYGAAAYTFTANGDLQTVTLAGATTTYQYDSFGNLLSVTLPGGATTIEYVVDAQNRRVAKKLNGNTTRKWVYGDQLRIVAELAPDGATISRFVYGSRETVPDYMIRNSVTYRIVSDYRGSPRLVVNIADGNVAQRIDYDEFGNVLSDSNPGFQPFGFAGGLYDTDTRLVRFGVRDYDARTGRWTAKDPILFDASGTNLYAYALGDPINNLDPTGMDTITADPHNLEKFFDLFEKGGSGNRQTERSSFVTQPPQMSDPEPPTANYGRGAQPTKRRAGRAASPGPRM